MLLYLRIAVLMSSCPSLPPSPKVGKLGKAGKAEGWKRERGRRETVGSVSKRNAVLHTYTEHGLFVEHD